VSRAAVQKTKSPAPTVQGRPVRICGHRAGHLVGWDGTTPMVDFPGNPHGPLAARRLDPTQGKTPAAGDRPEVLLTFESERSDRPILLGFLAPTTPAPGAGAVAAVESAEAGTTVDAVVDGKRVVIEGQDEIVLKCGLASITLRRNGRVVVRGTYVETRANGVNRIRGGTVEIN